MVILIFNLMIIDSFQYKTGFKDFNIKTSGVDDSYTIYIENFGLDMIIDLNNCIYVMAAENHYSGLGYWYYGDLILMKYSSNREQMWKIDIEGLRLDYSGIAIDSKSNLYLASMYENQSIIPNMVLYKFNSSGNLEWEKTWGSGIEGNFKDIKIDSADNIYVIVSGGDLCLVKYNGTGNQQWLHKYEEDNINYEVFDMDINSNNDIIISGESWWVVNETISFSYWLRCYNQSGGLKWNISNIKGRILHFAVDSFDNVISINRTCIVKFDNLGNLIWNWDHHIEFYWHVKIAFDSFNNIFIATIIEIPEDHHTYDLYLIKINSSGNFDWFLTWGGKGDEDLIAIDIDSHDNIYLLSDHFILKNPKSNGKSLTNIKLWNLFMILFVVCIAISAVSLYFILKHRTPQRLRIEKK